MTTPSQALAHSAGRSAKIARVLERRMRVAQDRFNNRVTKAAKTLQASPKNALANPGARWSDWANYTVDTFQRSVLFADTLRQRGNAYHEHEAAGRPPLLHFDHETVLDARTFARPVNYALVRIVPPEGVTVDPTTRPYVIIDPRAGHGPGIGGFKDDSQVGVALRAGHPVYFVVFFPDPEPGQTLPDVCAAEQVFVRRVRELHPKSLKPAIVGNCQGGWATMMLAASRPETTGPVVINGAPLSYWSGNWGGGDAENPMRYSGGLLGGSWLASMSADLGNGVFDGAHLVSNFANLNPANALWDKYYNLYARIDTEPPRFLEFERWWGGFYLMNREEIDWIVQNLFVGNKLWSGTMGSSGKSFDLREIRSPIILFASMGDNITPPEQAFNWVADVYSSTDEIKARGQVIIGLLHKNIGHLGIFVSGKVATKEHAQIVEVLESIESLPPGLYGMQIDEVNDGGKVQYSVSFVERQLEEIAERFNRFERKDEEPFEAVAEMSEFNQKAYELFAQPLVQAMSNETTAEIGRRLNPMRLEQGVPSDRNPWFAWVAPMAEMVRGVRQPAPEDSPFKQAERAASTWISASLDYYRDIRDAASEALFFQTFGILFPALHPGMQKRAAKVADETVPPREQAVVQQALAAIEQGGYADALARAACLLARKGEPLPLARVELKSQLAREYADLLPPLTAQQWHTIRGRQELICRYEPEQALATLPKLLKSADDRERFVTLLDRLLADARVTAVRATPAQEAAYERIREALPSGATRQPPMLAAAARKRTRTQTSTSAARPAKTTKTTKTPPQARAAAKAARGARK